MSNDLISAKLVWDGGDDVFIPEQLGVPRGDQMQGSPGERLVELAGRVCYDSLGKGRPSFTTEVVAGADPHTGEQLLSKIEGYHDHIHSVNHGSVWEHFNVTLEVRCTKTPELIFALLNRPGLTVLDASQFIRVTLNPRVVNDWDGLTLTDDDDLVTRCGKALRFTFAKELHAAAPSVVRVVGDALAHYRWEVYGAKIVEPVYDTEKWISMFVSGSRGLSHELVRHGDFTAISQRSTRFVDESESPWVEHPLATAFVDSRADKFTNPALRDDPGVIAHARNQYRSCVEVLEPWLIARGVDKLTARKQARGAARGYLGNALYTELIFSANVAQWKRMLQQRASAFADAEIRELFCKVLAELKRSRYADCFDRWSLKPSLDGIGQVAVVER